MTSQAHLSQAIPLEPSPYDALAQELDRAYEKLDAVERVERTLDRLPGVHVLSSSFGAQSAVSLHLLTQAQPDIPVVLIDTGYLFPETYDFVGELQQRLSLNLHIYSNPMTPSMQEAVYGQRWLQGVDGIEAYNFDNKVLPMRRALEDLGAGTWITGIRRDQSNSRAEAPFVQFKEGRFKVAPIADWSDQEVHRYLQRHDLPYHPLWAKGYVSIGDTHTTRSVYEVDHEDEVRFFGLKRECGLHE